MAGWQLRGPVWLFVPADRPDRIGKAAAVADHVVVDLEDGVDPAGRAAARAGLAAAVAPLDPDGIVVRINALDTPDATADLAAVRDAGLSAVMVPKAADPQALGRLGDLAVVVLCESAAGVVNVERLAAASGVVAVMWGSVDLAADLRCQPGDPVLDHARHRVLFAARAAGRVAVDHVGADLDDAAVATDAAAGAAAGFDAKACLHPRHVPLLAAAFTPGADQVAWATRIVGTAPGSGAHRIGDQFVDHAVLTRARQILARQQTASRRKS